MQEKIVWNIYETSFSIEYKEDSLREIYPNILILSEEGKKHFF